MKRPLGDIVELARKDFGVDVSRPVDWAWIDQAIFARIEQDREIARAALAKPRDRRWAYFASGAMAVAAALGILVGKGHESARGRSIAARAEPPAGRISEIRGEGSLLVNGSGATAGTSVRLGDGLETRGGEATIVREGAASVVIEQSSRVSIRAVRETLVLALERGAVEARVTPVASGEAFAVDVGDTRIAVHGTVLRVARSAQRAIVDLTEGVVSVGPAPRSGPVLGALVAAPAHFEFSVADGVKTLSVSHDPGLVRSVPVSGASAAAAISHSEAPERSLRSKPESNASRSQTVAAPGRADGRAPGAGAASQGAASGEVGVSESVEAAVLACMRERPRAENVTVVVSTTLYLDVGDDGAVRTARFDPPVMPEVNGCAAPAIYKAHFAHAGPVALPIEFKN